MCIPQINFHDQTGDVREWVGLPDVFDVAVVGIG